MPPKVGSSCSAKNTTSVKHTKATKKRPTRKNAKAIKKPGKNTGLNLPLNSDTSQVSVHAEQPQPPVSYKHFVSLINSEGMDKDFQDNEIEEDEMEEGDIGDNEMEDDNEGFGQLGPPWGYA
ncbi:uncharacterized protein F5891DRAFT_979985 [Suillus fuscotomentosus]|uniref:Uncharacterized protein n=1 Tax=Suillus fuscotomentosus TaxID=1912939 RepID=A0AAD4E714_9AGAM|nr:uncharacterized protein F5891DRAFT_979985 [Suillus fuscotomentosus]KAG1900755.1 hypothetical protein F5891DRAFT_979985 [Suillus fuscotomentosus]